jgi:hypothetical protein
VLAAARAQKAIPTTPQQKAAKDAIKAEIDQTRNELSMNKPKDAFIARLAPFIEIVLSVVRKICAALVIIAFSASSAQSPQHSLGGYGSAPISSSLMYSIRRRK